jgi:hypothetical protein
MPPASPPLVVQSYSCAMQGRHGATADLHPQVRPRVMNRASARGKQAHLLDKAGCLDWRHQSVLPHDLVRVRIHTCGGCISEPERRRSDQPNSPKEHEDLFPSHQTRAKFRRSHPLKSLSMEIELGA